MTTITYQSISGKTVEREFQKGELIPEVIRENTPYGSETEEFLYRVKPSGR